jgi:hypothetical protein
MKIRARLDMGRPASLAARPVTVSAHSPERQEARLTGCQFASLGRPMQIWEVHLQANRGNGAALHRFYGHALGLPAVDGPGLTFRVGATLLAFDPVHDGEPYYHFAIRVPRNRFDQASTWLAARAELLPQQGTGERTFAFENWNALACYVHDPCGNIVELIAHGELPEETPLDTGESFSSAELLSLCEVGVVGVNTRAMALDLESIGIPLWDGSVERDDLAFMGSRDGVLILSPIDRGWLPTRRPAEQHPVVVDLAGPQEAAITLAGTPHRVRTTTTSRGNYLF